VLVDGPPALLTLDIGVAVAQHLEITEYSPSPDARQQLERLVGRTVYTISDRKPNTILRLDKEDVIVGTGKAPDGEPVPVAWVQTAIDRPWAARELRISTESLAEAESQTRNAVATVAAAKEARGAGASHSGPGAPEQPERGVVSGLGPWRK
jgi:hypothetical protein